MSLASFTLNLTQFETFTLLGVPTAYLVYKLYQKVSSDISRFLTAVEDFNRQAQSICYALNQLNNSVSGFKETASPFLQVGQYSYIFDLAKQVLPLYMDLITKGIGSFFAPKPKLYDSPSPFMSSMPMHPPTVAFKKATYNPYVSNNSHQHVPCAFAEKMFDDMPGMPEPYVKNPDKPSDKSTNNVNVEDETDSVSEMGDMTSMKLDI